jgi:hypothetical protein
MSARCGSRRGLPRGRGLTGTLRERRPYICNDTLGDANIFPGARPSNGVAFEPRPRSPFTKVAWSLVCSPSTRTRSAFQDKEIALTGAAADLSFALEGAIRDDERRRAEAAALSRRRSRTRCSIACPVSSTSDRQGRSIRWNRNLESVSGYSRTRSPECARPTSSTQRPGRASAADLGGLRERRVVLRGAVREQRRARPRLTFTGSASCSTVGSTSWAWASTSPSASR